MFRGSQMATSFRKMDNSVLGHRIRGLTADTTLHQTLNDFIDLTETLWCEFRNILPGKIQSNRIEGEFGIYRQSGDGNFLISAEQVISSLQLSLFSIDNVCCKFDSKDSEEDPISRRRKNLLYLYIKYIMSHGRNVPTTLVKAS